MRQRFFRKTFWMFMNKRCAVRMRAQASDTFIRPALPIAFHLSSIDFDLVHCIFVRIIFLFQPITFNRIEMFVIVSVCCCRRFRCLDESTLPMSGRADGDRPKRTPIFAILKCWLVFFFASLLPAVCSAATIFLDCFPIVKTNCNFMIKFRSKVIY